MALLCSHNSHSNLQLWTTKSWQWQNGTQYNEHPPEGDIVALWQEGYTFSGSVTSSQLVILSHTALKGCKLQNNSSWNVSNQEQAPKNKHISAGHQLLLHWGGQERVKNGKECLCPVTKPLLSLSLCLKPLLGSKGAAHWYWPGWSLQVKDWAPCLFLSMVYLSLSD